MFCTKLWTGELSDNCKLSNEVQEFRFVPKGRLPLVDAEPVTSSFRELPSIVLTLPITPLFFFSKLVSVYNSKGGQVFFFLGLVFFLYPQVIFKPDQPKKS